MNILAKKRTSLSIAALLLVASAVTACERSDPVVVLKDPRGKEAYVSYDDVKEQPRFMRYKKSPYMRKKIAELKKRERERERGRYPRASRWDY